MQNAVSANLMEVHYGTHHVSPDLFFFSSRAPSVVLLFLYRPKKNNGLLQNENLPFFLHPPLSPSQPVTTTTFAEFS